MKSGNLAATFFALLTGGVLAQIGAGPAYEDSSSLWYLARKGDLNGVKALINKEPGLLDEQDIHQRTALHYAATADRRQVVDFLVKHKPRPGLLYDKKGHTPVHMAIMYGRLEVVEIFRKERCDIMRFAEDGATPLHFAVGNIYTNTHGKHREMVKYLLRHERSPAATPSPEVKWMVNVPNKNGETSLHLAAGIVGQLSALNALLDHPKIEVDVQCKEGRTALHYAVMHMSPRFVAALVGAGANLSIRDKDGRTAKDLAIMLTPTEGSKRESMLLIARLVNGE